MQLDRQSAVILPFPRAGLGEGGHSVRKAELDSGRIANLALMAVVFALAAIWLIVPPAQLANSSGPQSAASTAVVKPGR
jgi:hypothetical protein